MTEQTTDEGRGVSVTLKAGTEFSAPWVVCRGGSIEEVTEILNNQGKVKALLNIAAQAGREFQAVYRLGAAGVTGEVTQVQTAPTPQAQPAQAAPQGGPPAPQCPHGAMVWKDFTSKAGNHVRGHFCPGPGRTDCKPQFAPRG
jgi:hypothetical protein